MRATSSGTTRRGWPTRSCAWPGEAVSFAQDVKRELASIVPAEEHCRRAQLSGLLFAAGTFEIASGSHYTVRVSSRLPAVARSALLLLRLPLLRLTTDLWNYPHADTDCRV